MAATLKVLLGYSSFGQHRASPFDVPWLAVVGGAHKSKIGIVEAALSETTSVEDGKGLSWLCSGSHQSQA